MLKTSNIRPEAFVSADSLQDLEWTTRIFLQAFSDDLQLNVLMCYFLDVQSTRSLFYSRQQVTGSEKHTDCEVGTVNAS